MQMIFFFFCMGYTQFTNRKGETTMKNIMKKTIALTLILCFMIIGAGSSASALEYSNSWMLQTGTALGKAGANFAFAGYSDYNGDGTEDLWAVKMNGCGTKKTELHVLDGRDYGRFLLQTGTGLGEVRNDEFQFCTGDYDRDGKADLICIKVRNTGTKRTEIHVLSGASGFSKFILQTGTGIEEGKDNWEFLTGDWNGDGRSDIIGVKRNNGRGKTEVHILDGASAYQKFLLQTVTALHNTNGENWQFAAGDFDQDGRMDLCAVNDCNTGTKTTELHILSGKDSFTRFCHNSGTILGCSNGSLKFLAAQRDGRICIAGIKGQNTGTGKTEVHIMSVAPAAKTAAASSSGTNADNGTIGIATQLRMPMDNAKCSWRDGGSMMSWGGQGSSGYHAGIDLKSASGSQTIKAFGDGVVVDKGRNGGENTGNGYYVTIKHTLPSGETVYSFYGHLKQPASVNKNDTVRAGQAIGIMGSTGNSSGPHLHFAIANRLVSGGGYKGYVAKSAFSANRYTVSYSNVKLYYPVYVIETGRLPG